MVVGAIVLVLSATLAPRLMGACERITATYVSHHGNLTDCKWSHEGSEYSGKQSATFAGERCRSWTDLDASKHPDEAFSDGSRAAARNYCRNPSGRRVGPWCYPIGRKEAEDCAVRLCSVDGCRQTGSGVEYVGDVTHSTSGARCLKWSAILKYKASNIKLHKFPDGAFPEMSRKWARRYCRNPDGSPGGPWCYVQDEASGKVHREYCDVKMCTSPGTGQFVTPASLSRQDTFMKVRDGETWISLSARLWEPSGWKEADIRLTVTSAATFGATADQLWRAQVGLEVLLKPFGIAVGSGGNSRVITTVPFSATRPSNVTVEWESGHVKISRDAKQVLRVPFKPKEPFAYFAVSGKNVVWDIVGPERTVVTIGSDTGTQMRPLVASPTGYHVQVWLRSRGGACVDLQETPVSRFPHVRLCFDDKNSTTVYYQRQEKEAGTVLREERSFGVVSWWEWGQISVALDLNGVLTAWRIVPGATDAAANGDAVQLLRLAAGRMLRTLRWFGFSTKGGTVAYWSLSQRPSQDNETGRPEWPECVSSQIPSYSGSQWTSESGKPCRLWSLAKSGAKQYDSASPYSLPLNFCRRLFGRAVGGVAEPGVYCLVGAGADDRVEACDVRPCREGDCRQAGVATDYVGDLASTRSNRTCRLWAEAAPAPLANDSLYPERSLHSARNLCRNPSRSPSGPWCYTTDEEAAVDLCLIPDCDVPDECIVLTQGMSDDRGIFVLPEWRAQDGHGLRIAIKQWDPFITDGLTLELRPANKSGSERLIIGQDANHKIRFERVDSSGQRVFSQQSEAPCPILAGKWSKLWLRVLRHQLQLGVGASPIPLATFPSLGDVAFLDYYSSHGHTLGTSFTCSECHVEEISSNRWGRMMPLSYRRPGPRPPQAGSASLPLRLWLQGSGVANVAVVKLPNADATTAFSIGINSTGISLLQDASPAPLVLAAFKAPSALILPDQWTQFSFRLDEHLVQVHRMEQVVFEWRPAKPFLVYFFAVAASQGSITWTANCAPPPVEWPARHGGWSSWSPWSCSVTCGGGRGRRRRTCTAPQPNLLGRFCEGVAVEAGPCNRFPCGKIAPNTLTALRASLQLHSAALSLQVGQRTAFSCGESLVALLRREAPGLARSIAWTKNALPLPRNLTDGLSVRLNPIILSDAGVYVCQVDRKRTQERLTLRVIVLTVLTPAPAETVQLRVGLSKQLRCPSLELALLFSGLRVRWLHSDGRAGTASVEGRPLSDQQDEELLLTGIKTNEGVWECVVYNVDLNISWRTSWHRVQILSGPTFFTHLLEDRVTKWLFAWTGSQRRAQIFLFFLLAILTLCVCFSVAAFSVYLRSKR